MPTDLLAAPGPARPSPSGPVDLLAAADPRPKAAAPTVDLLATAPRPGAPPVDLLAPKAPAGVDSDAKMQAAMRRVMSRPHSTGGLRLPAELTADLGDSSREFMTFDAADLPPDFLHAARENRTALAAPDVNDVPHDWIFPLPDGRYTVRREAARSHYMRWLQFSPDAIQGAELGVDAPRQAAQSEQRVAEARQNPYPGGLRKALSPEELAQADAAKARMLQLPRAQNTIAEDVLNLPGAVAGNTKRLAAGVTGVLSHGGGISPMTSAVMGGRLEPTVAGAGEGTPLREASEALGASANKTIEGNPIDNPVVRGVAAAPEIAGAIGAGAVGGPGGLAAFGAAQSGGNAYQAAFDDQYRAARERGLSHADAKAVAHRGAFGPAAVSAVTGAIVNQLRLPGDDPAAGLIENTIRHAMTGGGIGTAQSTVDQVAQHVGYGRPIDVAGIIDAGIENGLLTAGTHVATHLPSLPTNPLADARAAEPELTRPPTMETPTAPSDTAAVRTGPAPAPANEFDLQPTITLRRLARDQGIDPRLPREQLIDALRKPVEESEPVDLLADRPAPATPEVAKPEAATPNVADEPAPPESPKPHPVRNEGELERMNGRQLAAEAERWDVTADAPSTTIPRILDAQARWRLGQMTDKQLWDEVRGQGLRAGNRERNIDTLLGVSREVPSGEQPPQELNRPREDARGDADRQEQQADQGTGLVPAEAHAPSVAETAKPPDAAMEDLSTIDLRRRARDAGLEPRGTRDELLTRLAKPEPGEGDEPTEKNNEGTAPPAPRVPVVETPRQTPANEPAAQSQPQTVKPSRTPVKRNPRPFTKTDLESRILQHYNETMADADATAGQQAEDAGQGTGGAATVFRGAYPPDLVDRFTPEEFRELRRKRIVRLAQGEEHAGGEDAISESGMGIDRYEQMLRSEMDGGKAGRMRRAIDHARGGQDPEMQLLAAIHDNMPASRDRGPTSIINPSEKPPGTKFTLFGSEFEIVEHFDENGESHRLLKDGDEYPVLPAEAIEKMPVDRGSVKEGSWEPPEPEGGFLDGIGDDEDGGAVPFKNEPAAPTSDAGVFGQDIPRPATGKNQGSLFHEPTTVERPPESAEDARIRGKFGDGDGATGKLFKGAPETPPGEGEKLFKGRRSGGRKALPGKDEPDEGTRRRQIAEALFGERSFVGSDVIPTAENAARGLAEAASGLRRVFAPQTVEGAAPAKGAIREYNAVLARKMDQATELMRKARWHFEGQDKKANYDFINRMEQGQPQATPQLSAFAKSIRRMLDDGRREVQSLGTGKLEGFYQDYFPHIWKDPDAAASMIGRVLGKRPLEGTKSFLKKRSIDLFSTGIEQGLEPVSDNPADLAMLKYREMQRYVFAHRVLSDLTEQGVLRYVPATQKAPEGYTRINDPVASVYGPPTVRVKEYVDRMTYEGLSKLAGDLGIRHDRLMNAGRGALGFSLQGRSSVVSQFGTGESVLAHEIGHQLDAKFGMLDHFFHFPDPQIRSRLKREMRAIADLNTASPDEPEGHARPEFRKRVEQVADVMMAYIHARPRMAEVAPTVLREFESFIYRRPVLRQIKDVQHSLAIMELTGEQPHGGLLKMGEYYAPDAAATVLNNHLSPGLRNRSGAMRAFMGAANFYNAAQLGLSGYHLGMTSIDAATSKYALAIMQGVYGDKGEAIRTATKIPIAPLENVLRGRQVYHEWLGDAYHPGRVARAAGKYLLDPLTRLTGANLGTEELKQIVDSMVAAGGRAKMDDFYRTGLTDKMLDAFRKGNVAGGILRLPFAAFDAAAKPILEYIVPRQKLGVFADMARFELERLGADADRAKVREAMARAWDSVDNRMGQVVYDNLFWHRTAKDLAMLNVRSVGWNLGTIREFGGGTLDAAKAPLDLAMKKKPELTHRMAYMIAAPQIAAAVGATLMYLLTGKGPTALIDYFYPKTGKTDAEGNEQRLALPSYMKDLVSYARHPVETLKHKVHPSLDLLVSMLENKDFYGTKIVNEDDPAMKRLIDRAKFTAKSLTPFGVQGYQKMSEDDLPGMRKALPFVGFTPAPASLTMTAAEQKAREIQGERDSVGGRTQEQADRAKVKRDLAKSLKQGKPDANAKVDEAVQSGALNGREARDVRRRAELKPLEFYTRAMSAPEVARVYRAAQDEKNEKDLATLRPIYLRKLLREKATRGGRLEPEMEQALVSLQATGVKPAADDVE